VIKYHHIDFDSARKNIFVTSGLDEPLVVAIKGKDIVERTTAVADVIGWIKKNGIVHMVIDPLVSTHRGVNENSNEEMEQVAEAIRHIAHKAGCSVDLVHHSLKSHSHNTEVHAGDMNAARGAGALIGAVRVVYTLSQMNEKTAQNMGVPDHQAARLVRLDHGKGNYTARDTSVRWFELITVAIENGADMGGGFLIGGDTVAVPVRWHPTAVDADAARDDPKEGDPKEARRQRDRDFVAKMMQKDRCELSGLIEELQRGFGIAKTTARNRIMKAIPDECWGLAQVNDVSYRLTIEREKPSPPKPVFVVRTIMGGNAEDGAGEDGGPAASDAGTNDDIQDEAA
jgi:AAA domain